MSALGPLRRALHAAAGKAGLDEEARRDLMARETGKRSTKDMDAAELRRVLDSINALRPRQLGPVTAAHRKVLALWIAAWAVGGVDRRDDAALDAFVRRQVGVDALRFLSDREADRVVEALKAICGRAGFEVPRDDPGGMKGRRALVAHLRGAVAQALGRLPAGGALPTGAAALDREIKSLGQLRRRLAHRRVA